MIRKPKQMSESMVLGVVLTLAEAFRTPIPTTAGERCSPTPKPATSSFWARIASGNFQNALHYVFPPAGVSRRGLSQRVGTGALQGPRKAPLAADRAGV